MTLAQYLKKHLYNGTTTTFRLIVQPKQEHDPGIMVSLETEDGRDDRVWFMTAGRLIVPTDETHSLDFVDAVMLDPGMSTDHKAQWLQTIADPQD